MQDHETWNNQELCCTVEWDIYKWGFHGDMIWDIDGDINASSWFCEVLTSKIVI